MLYWCCSSIYAVLLLEQVNQSTVEHHLTDR
jgi:hypothetical protein